MTRDRRALGILALAALGILGALPGLRTPDLGFCYSFMTPDSWDWLANGLYWAGAPLLPSFRPPGLPLLVALLSRFSALPLLPFLNYAALGLSAALLYRLVRLRHDALVAALAVLLFVSNGSLFGHVRYVMAEVYTLPFLVGAAIAFERAATRPRLYVVCSLLLSVSFLFHYAGLVAGLGLAVTLALFRRPALRNACGSAPSALRTRWPWIALLAAAPLPVAWLAFRALQYRAHPEAGIHVIEGLVRLSAGNLRYYGVVAIALCGLLAIPLYAAGFSRLVKSRTEPWSQAVLGPLLALGLFFTFLYDWKDKRFLYYLFPFAVCAAAEGIAALREWGRGGRGRAFATVAFLVLSLLWNRIPYPRDTSSLVAFSPYDFLDAAMGLRTATWKTLPVENDGFLSFRSAPTDCRYEGERVALPAVKRALDEHLAPGEPVGLDFPAARPEHYWAATNRLAIALGRRVGLQNGNRALLRIEPDGSLRAFLDGRPLAVPGS